jgi:hypothetical protein
MNPLLFQVIIPFFLSALIVILIMYIAERYGTKTGGIIGTLPSTIVIAFIFIALNHGVTFAAQSVAVVPAELGINLIFLLFFALIVHRSVLGAFLVSFLVWIMLSALLFLLHINNIYISLGIFGLSLLITFSILEHVKQIPSAQQVIVDYTPRKIALRGILAGIVITVAVLLSNLGATLSGIFSVFPAIISSTMLISVKEHGPDFAAGIAKSMTIGSSSILIYATVIHILYPPSGILIGTIVAYALALCYTLLLFTLRGKLK